MGTSITFSDQLFYCTCQQMAVSTLPANEFSVPYGRLSSSSCVDPPGAIHSLWGMQSATLPGVPAPFEIRDTCS